MHYETYLLQVEFVDYGNVEECTIGDLKKKIVLEDIPIQCTKCLIDGLNPVNSLNNFYLSGCSVEHVIGDII